MRGTEPSASLVRDVGKGTNSRQLYVNGAEAATISARLAGELAGSA